VIPRVVLAPLAGGPFTPELAAAVSNAGGLGFVAAGYLSAETLRERIRATRALTDRPIGVNLFVLHEQPVDEAAVAAYGERLAREGFELGEPHFDDDELAAKIQVVAEERVPVVSTTFGPPPTELVARVPEVWATVTTPEEARRALAAGARVLVLQGAEAGGHRGSWDDADGPDLPVRELVAQTRGLGVPLVAAGGLDHVPQGADAVQAGTAFLLCPEAGTSEPHRRALAEGRATAVTRAFTGRRARGLVNRFMTEHEDAPKAYPHVHHLTAPLRAAARAAGDPEALNLWAGAGAAPRAQPAADVVARLGA